MCQFWQAGYHPIALDTEEKFWQRINYLNENSVRAGIVWEAVHYKYSSAIDYYEQRKGLLDVALLFWYLYAGHSPVHLYRHGSAALTPAPVGGTL